MEAFRGISGVSNQNSTYILQGRSPVELPCKFALDITIQNTVVIGEFVLSKFNDPHLPLFALLLLAEVVSA